VTEQQTIIRARRWPLSRRQKLVVAAGVLAVALVGGGVTWAATSSPGNGATAEAATSGFDISSRNAADRPRIDPVPDAVAQLADSGFHPVEPGKLTVASNLGAAPLGIFAEDDNTTPLGSEIDFAQLIADGLGLELNVVPVSWADWPLGVSSGKYDLVASNVTVTEERLEIYDIATYRQDLLGFYVKAGSDLDDGRQITDADGISGLTVAVSSGTNQEQVLLRWNEELTKQGKKPAELKYFDDTAAAQLALSAGRIDATFGPNAQGAWTEANTGDVRQAGIVPGGWPRSADIGAATKKGNGLVDPIATVLRATRTDATDHAYDKVLERWGLEQEAVDKVQINPPGLPKQG
jgi:polar amino acid transport system substrate-binding protein